MLALTSKTAIDDSKAQLKFALILLRSKQFHSSESSSLISPKWFGVYSNKNSKKIPRSSIRSFSILSESSHTVESCAKSEINVRSLLFGASVWTHTIFFFRSVYIVSITFQIINDAKRDIWRAASCAREKKKPAREEFRSGQKTVLPLKWASSAWLLICLKSSRCN